MSNFSTFCYSNDNYNIYCKLDYNAIYFTINNKINENNIFTGSVYLIGPGKLHKIIAAFVYNTYTIVEQSNNLSIVFNLYDGSIVTSKLNIN